MIRRTLWRAITILVILSMAVPFVLAAPSTQPPQPPERAELQWAEELASDLAMTKLDPSLRDAAEQGGKELVDLYVTVLAGTDLSKYMSNMIVRPVVFGGVQNIYGQTTASNLLAIAQNMNVVALVGNSIELRDTPYDPESEDASNPAPNLAHLEELRANELTYAEAAALTDDVGPEGWFDVLNGHQSGKAWEKGFDGDGVIVGVMDDGVDFGHSDLQGTSAVVTDENSPYYGWPMAYSQVSVRYFAGDVINGSPLIAAGGNGSRWTDAQTTITPTGSTVAYQTLGMTTTQTYTIPSTSLSGAYKLGSHPDRNLLNAYGNRVAVLVVDEGATGVYDTVYVDLDNDYDFTDEKPNTKNDPYVYRDMDGDTFADISGGVLVWISDGANVPPTADWLWGISCANSSATMQGCPDSGELVLFAGAFDGGSDHGTRCASNVAAQGQVNGGLSAQPFRVGGMVQGAAPAAGVMDFGNHYYNGTDEDDFLVVALGYDGVANSGDEIQISSNSYGNFRQMWGGWGYYGRLLTAMNTTIAPTSLWLFSTGNEGPGYGPQEGDGSPTTLMIGSSTQYGSTNWDSISSADQIMYGDPNSYYSHGPNRDGSTGVDVLANGGRGSGTLPVNQTGFDGDESWETWGGTSRSAPFAAGSMALIYQAYKARYGVWPTWDVAKAIVKSGATNSVSSPFYQGGGIVNSDRNTDLAAGIYGVYATPDEWQVGDWEGTDYLNFANVAYPGDTFTKTYTVNNPSGHNITVDLTDGVMTLITKTETTFTTSDESLESDFNFHSPDYLMQLDDSLIPADAEVMIVRYVQPYISYDPELDYAVANNSWRFLLYNWTDQNGDDMLWQDLNANGTVNHAGNGEFDNDGFERLDFITTTTEIQQGEYVRVDYEFGGTAVPIIVHDPLERMADGYFFGFQHRRNDNTVATTTLQIGIEFYKRADWDWLSLSDSSLAVPGEDSATFDATMAVAASADPGMYEGVIFMNDSGDQNHAAHETALPVVVNVISDLPDDGAVTLGGNADLADTMYQNSHTFGYFNWYGGGWTGAGDWRHYFLNIDAADVAADNLLIHTSWAITPTDINTWVLGPTDDCASNGVAPCATFGNGTYAPNLGQPDPTLFGPYTLQPIAANDPFLAGATYPFHTSTGGPDDWTLAPIDRVGLHEIALHNVVYEGGDLTEMFQVDVGTLSFDAEMDPAVGTVTLGSVDAVAYTDTGSIEFQFTPSIEIPDLYASLAGGLSTTHVDDTVILPDSGQCGDNAWCADTQWFTNMIDIPGTTNLRVYIPMPAGEDIDLFVYYDADDNGIAEQGVDTFIDASTNGAGNDDFVDIANPTLGTYLIGILGWSVTDNIEVDWYYEVTAPGNLPADPVEVYSDTVTVTGSDAGDYTTASFSTTVTMDNHISVLYATLTGIDPLDVDLYVTDDSGALVGSSVTDDVADEAVTVVPVGTNYRFMEGDEYTIWVHAPAGTAVYPVDVHLNVTWDVLNLWLSAEHADVYAASIGAGEMVSVTLHFDKAGWLPGDAPLSARFLASPSVLPNAFDELVIIVRGVAPTTPTDWDDDYLDVSLVGNTARGPSSFAPWTLGGAPAPTYLATDNELVTWTLTVSNDDPLFATPDLELWAEVDNMYQALVFSDPYLVQTFNNFVTPPVVGTYGYSPTNYLSASPVVTWTGSLASGQAFSMTWSTTSDAAMAIGDDSLSLVYDPIQLWIGGGQWTNVAGGDLYYRSFRLTGSYKDAPSTVLAGDDFTYNISLSNPGAEDRYVYLSDPLPDEVDFVSVTGGAVYDAGTHTVAWDGLLTGSSLSTIDFDINVTAKDTLTYSTNIVNQAVLTYTGGTLANFVASTMVGTDADLDIDKSVNAIEGSIGDALNYTLVFGNNGSEAAMEVVMEDVVPSYLDVDVDSVTATMEGLVYGGTVIYDAGTIRWLGDLAPTEEVTVTFQATINDTTHDELAVINMSTVVADNYPWTSYNSALTEILKIYYVYLPLVIK